MKTKKQILEIIHDSVLEDMTRMEVAIRNLHDKEDDEVIDTIIKRSPLGPREENVTKKKLVEEYKDNIEKRKHALATVKKLIQEEDDKRN